ncbi:MAG: hypothetical protein KDA37_08210 [Planctomycetales bacterium]|nr:hypothetical protein [Planctomycetales bacterium]MCB0994700.1 hypothetical protein [Acidimicrobiales bacterium]
MRLTLWSRTYLMLAGLSALFGMFFLAAPGDGSAQPVWIVAGSLAALGSLDLVLQAHVSISPNRVTLWRPLLRRRVVTGSSVRDAVVRELDTPHASVILVLVIVSGEGPDTELRVPAMRKYGPTGREEMEKLGRKIARLAQEPPSALPETGSLARLRETTFV